MPQTSGRPVFAAAFRLAGFGLLQLRIETVALGAITLVLTYLLGGVLLGLATFRARVLPRWAGVLLAAGTAIGPLAALLPLDLQPKVAVPVGLALIWLGWSLWSERRAKSAASLTKLGTSGFREAPAA